MINTELIINNISYYDAESIVLTKSLGESNGSSRLEASFYNTNGRHKNDFVEGYLLVLKANMDVVPSNKIFTGVITEVRFEGEGSTNERVFITARDYTAILQQSTVEPEVYTNREVSEIVIDLMQKYASVVSTVGVQTTTKILSRISFNQISVFDALQQLADFVNYVFYVNDVLELVFRPKGSISSGITLDNTNVTRIDFTRNIDNLRNAVYVYGDRQLFAHPQEIISTGSPLGGSVYFVQEQPHNTKVTYNGSEFKGAIYQMSTTISGAQYLIDYYDKKVIFVSGTLVGDNIPLSGGSFIINYDVSRPIIKYAEDPNSISLYGKRPEVIIDTNIKDATTARDVALNTLELKKLPQIQASAEVYGILDIDAGATVLINLPNENVSNETYSVFEASYDFSPNNCFKNTVCRLSLNNNLGDITDVLKELILSVKRLQTDKLDTGGILSRLITGTGSFGVRVSSWELNSRYIGNSFVLGHPQNGVLGSPAIAVNGSQVYLGENNVGSWIMRASGGI